MTPTLEHGYTEQTSTGAKKIVPNKTVAGLDNGHVGDEWLEFLEEFADDTNPFYAVAYLIEEYGDELREDLEDKTEDDLREYVIEIEERRAEPTQRDQEQRLKNLLSDANSAEREAILENAEDLLQDSDVQDAGVHEDIVNRNSN